MYKLLIFTTIVFVACKERHINSKNIESKLKSTVETLGDTLRNPQHFYYCADINPKTFAEWVLNDSIIPSDNYSTFRLMDSLEAKTLEDRKFYFSVFLKIKEKSDGALAEAIGLPALKYVENHTEEFLELSSKLPNETFESWAYSVGLEILFSNDKSSIAAADSFFIKLKENCTDCSNEQKSKLDIFYNKMIEAINQNGE